MWPAQRGAMGGSNSDATVRSGVLTAFCCLDALAVLLEQADLLPSVDFSTVDLGVGNALLDIRADEVFDVVVPERRVGRQTDLD